MWSCFSSKFILLCSFLFETTRITHAADKITTGDINNDGNISLVDARMVLQTVAETISLTETQTLAADMNGDGAITLVDARMALQAVTNSTK